MTPQEEADAELAKDRARRANVLPWPEARSTADQVASGIRTEQFEADQRSLHAAERQHNRNAVRNEMETRRIMDKIERESRRITDVAFVLFVGEIVVFVMLAMLLAYT